MFAVVPGSPSHLWKPIKMRKWQEKFRSQARDEHEFQAEISDQQVIILKNNTTVHLYQRQSGSFLILYNFETLLKTQGGDI